MTSVPAEDSRPRRDTSVRQLLRPLGAYLEDPRVTEVTVNRPEELWVKTFDGWTALVAPELTDNFLRALATALIVYNSLSPCPIVSVVLPDGQRGQIVLPPACLDGTLSLSIRKHMPVVKSLEELEREGAFEAVEDVSFNQPSETAADAAFRRQDFGRLDANELRLLTLKRERRWRQFLQDAVTMRRNIVIAGKTGSGKTTLARSLIENVPTAERLLTIEDVHELALPNHPNRVHMLYGSGADRISAEKCLASCMRQSPDRIFLAELRGNEAWDYVTSLNTGHPGAITTTHANSALLTFERIVTLIKQSEVGRELALEVIRNTLYTTIHVVIFVHERRVREVFYDPIFARTRLT